MADKSIFQRALDSIVDSIAGPMPAPPPNNPMLQNAPSILRGMGPKAISRVARQSRQMLPEEAQWLNKFMGGALNPNTVRVGYDPSTTGSTNFGYVDERQPNTTWFPSQAMAYMRHGDKLVAENVPGIRRDVMGHEMTHVWQNQNLERYTPENYQGYKWDPAIPFQHMGAEQQASVMGSYFGMTDSEKQEELLDNVKFPRPDEPMRDKARTLASQFIQAHAVNPVGAMADNAFLESVKQRLQHPNTLNYDTVTKQAGSGSPFQDKWARWGNNTTSE